MLTETQLQLRRGSIGASDAPAILGEDRFRSPIDVWAEKVHDVAPADQSLAMELGFAVEDHLLNWAAEETGHAIQPQVFRKHETGILTATHDALAVDHDEIGYEAKSVGLLGQPFDMEHWGENGSNQVPARVLIQTHHQMLVSNLSVVYVPAIVQRSKRLYRIERDDDLCAFIESYLLAWWKTYVAAGVQPPGAPALEIVRRIRRVPQSIVTLNKDIATLWDALQVTNENRLALEKAEDGLKAQIILAMGTAEGGQLPDGRLITFMETKRKGYTVGDTAYRTLKLFKEKKETKSNGNRSAITNGRGLLAAPAGSEGSGEAGEGTGENG